MNKVLGSIIFLFLFLSCGHKKEQVPDFQRIKEKGELTVITLNSSTSYFLYKDESMGYDYDLAKQFCDYYGLKLNVKVAENSTKLLEMLENGEGDLVAAAFPVQNDLKDSVIYCGLEQVSHQVLIQRTEKRDSMITDVTQLLGKEVYVKLDTKYYQRLQNLNNELGDGIILKDVDKDTITVEDLIEMVAQKEIDYTVADEYIAKLNKTYYRNIDISLAVSFEQRLSWIVRKDSPQLADSLDVWFTQNAPKPAYKGITKKYFELSKMPDGDYEIPLKLSNGVISPFDSIFKKYAKESNYDWFLLASIAYQESRFKTNLSSWAGAVGLMGVMPRTAASFGVSSSELDNPEVSIKVGVGLIDRLHNIFRKVEDPEQRLKFILAAYNGGNGHVADAQALARKYGADPYKWDGNVEKYMELKSNPDYYTDPVCKNGYLRGSEVVKYVRQVNKNRDKFKTLYKEKNNSTKKA